MTASMAQLSIMTDYLRAIGHNPSTVEDSLAELYVVTLIILMHE